MNDVPMRTKISGMSIAAGEAMMANVVAVELGMSNMAMVAKSISEL